MHTGYFVALKLLPETSLDNFTCPYVCSFLFISMWSVYLCCRFPECEKLSPPVLQLDEVWCFIFGLSCMNLMSLTSLNKAQAFLTISVLNNEVFLVSNGILKLNLNFYFQGFPVHSGLDMPIQILKL